MRRKVFKTMADARKFAKKYNVNDITITLCKTRLIYIVEYKPKSFISWWFEKNWQTLVVLILEWIIIGVMIAGCVLWLFE